MNEKTVQQIARMKEQTIGVEVEMNNITREKAARIAADFFGTHRYENTAGRNGYYTWSAWDSQGREWKFQRDFSIAGPDSEKCELVTPILHYSDIENLQELIRRLRKAGAISHAGIGAGVHIHIGANGHTPQSLRTLANIMASHENLIAEALKIDQGRMNRYRSTRKSLQQWHSLQTFGTHQTVQTTAEVSITTTADTICSTFTQPLQREQLNSDFSNLISLPTARKTDFTQDSLKATFSFALHSAKWQKTSEQQVQNHSSMKIQNLQ